MSTTPNTVPAVEIDSRIYRTPSLRYLLEDRAPISQEQVGWANAIVGRHFFDRDTLRFFRSRIDWKVYGVAPVVFFVTSEQYDARSPRLYTVRTFDLRTGEVETAPGTAFQEFGSLDSARRVARRMGQAAAPVGTVVRL